MSGFQSRVNLYQPPAVDGDFAGHNPRVSTLTIPGGFVAGLFGLTIARFAWIGPDGRAVNNYANGAVMPDGFVGRDGNMGTALITQYLGETSNLIPKGFMATLHCEGEFFVLNRGTQTTSRRQPVFASYADGTPYFGAAPAGATATGSIGSTFTATGTGTNLTVSAVTGLLSVGDTIAGTGVPAGTTIKSQTSGTPGAAGVYVTSVATTASAATVTSYGATLSVSAVSSGQLLVGDAISGTGVPANATIASQVSGSASGPGVYTLNTPATAYAASTALTVAGGIQTNWMAETIGAPGELVKITTWGKA